jgi:hypothetical protein
MATKLRAASRSPVPVAGTTHASTTSRELHRTCDYRYPLAAWVLMQLPESFHNFYWRKIELIS